MIALRARRVLLDGVDPASAGFYFVEHIGLLEDSSERAASVTYTAPPGTLPNFTALAPLLQVGMRDSVLVQIEPEGVVLKTVLRSASLSVICQGQHLPPGTLTLMLLFRRLPPG